MKHVLQDDPEFLRTSKLDVFIIGFVLVLSAVSLLWFVHKRSQGSSKPKTALIYLKGALVEQVDLGKGQTTSLLDGKMQIEIKNGKIRVLKADCPNQICVNMGWIQYSGQTIACVPNKAMIEIKPAPAQVLDAVTF